MRSENSFDQVLHVDVVANTGPVRGRVVFTEDRNFLALAERGLQNHGDQVRLRLVVFSDRAVGGAAGNYALHHN